jgi:hypothetical protein
MIIVGMSNWVMSCFMKPPESQLDSHRVIEHRTFYNLDYMESYGTLRVCWASPV